MGVASLSPAVTAALHGSFHQEVAVATVERLMHELVFALCLGFPSMAPGVGCSHKSRFRDENTETREG